MRLIVSEKNIAARRIAEILAVGTPKADKVYTTPVYRFKRDGDEWVSIGLKGHIMAVDFPEALVRDGKGWLIAYRDGREEPAPVAPSVVEAAIARALETGTTKLKRAVEAGRIPLDVWALEMLDVLVLSPIEKTPAEKGIIQSLKSLAKKAEEVIIATDFDREGELIGADARGVVLDAHPGVTVKRARFSAITKGEIERAFSELGVVSDDLAQAGEARQDIDLVWGAVLTRYLTISSNKAAKKAWGSVLSAGRVQTPTLKLIVDREKERMAFVPEDYWVVKAGFAKGADEFSAGHATERFGSEAEAQTVMDAVADAKDGTIAAVKKTRRQVQPPAPFNTTALMAAAASEGLSPANTMRIAESLYMDGLISYPRVDNTVYPPSLELVPILRTLSGVSQFHEHAERLLAKGQLTATRGSKEATDHPPIHPTGAVEPERLKPEQWKLYNMVARRFMATLSDAAVLESTRADIDVAGQRFVARGDVTVSPGFRAVYPYGARKEEELPVLAEGETVDFRGATMDAKQTQPPARYSQGRLIQEMEKLGLGTKATRHSIIQTLYDRKYAVNDPVEPTCQGLTIIDALSAHAMRITSPEMTRELEHDMDCIAEASCDRVTVVDRSRELLGTIMGVLLERTQQVGELLKTAADEDAKVGTCLKSGHDLLIKYSPKTRGYFVGCTGYPECDVTYPLPQGRYEAVEEPCPTCGHPQVKLYQFKQRPRVLCLNTQCETRREPEIVVGKCPTGDGGDLVVRRSPSSLKRFCRCTNYENCGTSYPLPQSGDIEPTGETCEPCGAPVIVVLTRKGPWRICVNPDCEGKKAAEEAKAAKGKAPAKGSAAKGKSSAAGARGRRATGKKTSKG